MPKMIQIRNVPDALHRKLKVRAAEDGRSLSTYLLRELEGIVRRMPLREMQEQLRQRAHLANFTSTTLIREDRDRR